MDAAEAWFHDAVIDGLSALQTLALPGTPPAETVTLTAQVWITSLWSAATWRAERDAPRLADAFVALAGKVDRWPAPRAVLDNLSPVPDVMRLPEPKPQLDEGRLLQLKAFSRGLRERMLINGGAPAQARANLTLQGTQDDR